MDKVRAGAGDDMSQGLTLGMHRAPPHCLATLKPALLGA